ncbi:NAD(P)/FAD-dependent oxidoreductase [Crocosphaera chwakensis]|uniref:Type 2 NADH dehydrogenase n=1 Tax=Crocosphaera chwakensis CCY0110 TaxID=391612 RepID=A3ISS8_9CHRO|nr:NAD(P)/FAD-dependent oxidoreductase [Crocosphaera chwakensis]EAZ90498.1 type 2 NADH dehydrogenase [Crocosphaera chwakensis CCY0110]
MNNSTTPTIIVGGGFVGLFTALHLSHRHYPHPIILIDPQERFVFKPLLYEYLTGEMQDEQVFPSYKELLEGSNVTFVQDTVTTIELQQQQITLASGLNYHYRHLVLGVGNIQGYFGTEGAKENAFPFRTQEDAINLERHLRDCLQKACQTENAQERDRLLTIAVVGAGPSGVEMAATLADLLPSWYGKLGGNIQKIKIVLINHGTEILSGDVNAHLRETALEALNSRSVPVALRLGVKVIAVDANNLNYQQKDHQDIEQLSTQTTIWTAGTATNPLIESLGDSLGDHKNKHGLPFVTSTLQLSEFPEVFAAGDCAVVEEHPFPPVAQIAYQQGADIADNLMALSQGKKLQPADPSMRGTLMKLGINNGVADLFEKIQVTGKAGDLIRNGTYLELLPTPVHNFKATTNWLTDEIFHHHSVPQTETKTSKQNRNAIWLGGFIAAIALVVVGIILWHDREPSPQQEPVEQPVSLTT